MEPPFNPQESVHELCHRCPKIDALLLEYGYEIRQSEETYWRATCGASGACTSARSHSFTVIGELDMPLVAEKEMEHIGETHVMENHDHDLVHALSHKLDCIWRCDQYISNAEKNAELQQFWLDEKQHALKSVERLKELIKKEIAKNCF